VYRKQCAACHGLYGLPASFAKGMFPEAPQLWEPHGHDVVGVSDDPPGETYWKVANGIRLSGMPAFKHVLNETEMWQVSQLLANADKPLPPGVLTLLKQPLDLDPAAPQ
jgi:mono/diheme cytochrome c family protein